MFYLRFRVTRPLLLSNRTLGNSKCKIITSCSSFITMTSVSPLSTGCSTADISSQLTWTPFPPLLQPRIGAYQSSVLKLLLLFLPYRPSSTSSSISMMSTTTYLLKALSPAKAIYSLSFRRYIQLEKQIHMGNISQLQSKVKPSSYPRNLSSLLYSRCNQ